MPKNSRKDSIGSYVGIAIIAVVLVIFAGYYGYAIYKQNQIDNYNKSVQDIILETSKKNVKLNPYLRNFVVVPEQAKKFAPKFEKAAANTKEAVSDLKAIEPPRQFETKHRKLTKAYEDGAEIYSDLNKLAGYLIERDKVLKKLIKDLKSFTTSITEAKEQKKAKDIAKQADVKISEDVKSIKELKSPISIYNDKILIEYSNSLTKHLRDFQKTLAGNDIYKIQMALYYIQLDYAKNWQKAFFSSDKKALKDYEGRVKAVQEVTF